MVGGLTVLALGIVLAWGGALMVRDARRVRRGSGYGRGPTRSLANHALDLAARPSHAEPEKSGQIRDAPSPEVAVEEEPGY